MNKDKRLVEALVVLSEECAEVNKEAMKIVRFGLSADNQSSLTKEVGDVLCLIRYLVHHGYISQDGIEEALYLKERKLKYWSSLYE